MFDANNNTNIWLPLLTPYAYHPYAPATGRAPAYALKQAYLYARTNSRSIGVQTYKTFNRDDITTGSVSKTIEANAYVGVGEWRVDLPPHATHIVCRASFKLYGIVGQLARVRHRLVVNDGTDTDTGADFTLDLEAQQPNDDENPSHLPHWTEHDGPPFVDEFFVQRVDTYDASNMLTCTVTAQAYAEDINTGAAIRYRPQLYVAAYEVID